MRQTGSAHVPAWLQALPTSCGLPVDRQATSKKRFSKALQSGATLLPLLNHQPAPLPAPPSETSKKHFSKAMRELVSKCLVKDPAKRPTAAQVRPWFPPCLAALPSGPLSHRAIVALLPGCQGLAQGHGTGTPSASHQASAQCCCASLHSVPDSCLPSLLPAISPLLQLLEHKFFKTAHDSQYLQARAPLAVRVWGVAPPMPSWGCTALTGPGGVDTGMCGMWHVCGMWPSHPGRSSLKPAHCPAPLRPFAAAEAPAGGAAAGAGARAADAAGPGVWQLYSVPAAALTMFLTRFAHTWAGSPGCHWLVSVESFSQTACMRQIASHWQLRSNLRLCRVRGRRFRTRTSLPASRSIARASAPGTLMCRCAAGLGDFGCGPLTGVGPSTGWGHRAVTSEFIRQCSQLTGCATASPLPLPPGSQGSGGGGADR